MESIVDEETPLAAYLEGRGTHEGVPNGINTSSEQDNDTITPTFAPSAHATFRSGFGRAAPKLHLRTRKRNRLSEAHITWSKAINSRIGRSDNEKFLEHFRYTIIASQLLNEHQDHGVQHGSRTSLLETGGGSEQDHAGGNPWAFQALCLVAGFAFSSVWLIHWVCTKAPSLSRVSMAISCFGTLGIFAYTYLRREWLEHLRSEAIRTISDLTVNMQAFEVSCSAALSLIQEVEVVSKGYKLSAPLPPISRLDDAKASRRLVGLRKQLQKVLLETSPLLIDSLNKASSHACQNDYQRFIGVYDIPRDAIQESISAPLSDDSYDESLGMLRILTYRYATLRRAFLCSLLSLEADGGAPDFPRWRDVNHILGNLSHEIATHARHLNQTLKDLEEFASPITPKPSSPYGAPSERLRSQVRKISTLSTGIRALQAKMLLLREESNRAIESSNDLTDLGPSLLSQYDSIGADLKSLMSDWETGKAALASSIGKHERRISLASTGLRSPVGSLGGLTAVGEDSDESGGPADALMALTGMCEAPGSNRSSFASPSDSEEVFEAIAMPRQRPKTNGMSREERIARVHEERKRAEEGREKRVSSTNMIRELQSVINLRKPMRTMDGRVTSI